MKIQWPIVYRTSSGRRMHTNLFIMIMPTETKKLKLKATVGPQTRCCKRLAPSNECSSLREASISSNALPENPRENHFWRQMMNKYSSPAVIFFRYSFQYFNNWIKENSKHYRMHVTIHAHLETISKVIVVGSSQYEAALELSSFCMLFYGSKNIPKA